jgi:uncharacterized membrane protein YfcA
MINLLEEPWAALLLLATGFIVGTINTVAGSGSLISLPVLMYFGLSPSLANGTNRLGILFQSLTASKKFRQAGMFGRGEFLTLGIPSILGAILGAFISISIPEKSLKTAIGFLLIFMLVILFFDAEKDLSHQSGRVAKWPKWVSVLLFFFIGAYGGFIQAGVGFFLLAGLVYGEGMHWTRANAWKVLIVFLFTPFALVVFIWNHQVDYLAGAFLALGGAGGGCVGAQLSLQKGAPLIRGFLKVFILFAALDLLGILRWIFHYFNS